MTAVCVGCVSVVIIFSCLFFPQEHRLATDRQTDGRTDTGHTEYTSLRYAYH